MLATQILQDLETENRDREQRYMTSEVSWNAYETLLAKIGDRGGYRIAYLDGTLEIMSPSRRHEGEKKRIATLLEAYFEKTDTEYFPLGSTTFRQPERSSGVEPDESYCIDTEKEFPDLVVEVIVTSGGTNKLEIYRRLQVTEVWFWQNDRFSLFRLQDEEYEPISRSQLLPNLDLDTLAKCVGYTSQLEAVKVFRRAIAPRIG